MNDPWCNDALVGALRVGRPVTWRALGHSMEPTIPAGSLVRVAPCEASALRRGDVAACVRPDGGLMLHRVVAFDGQNLVRTWGDAMPTPDDAPSPVVGKVVALAERPSRSWWFRAKGRLRVLRHMVRGGLFGER
jgi:signal peptidase I